MGFEWMEIFQRTLTISWARNGLGVVKRSLKYLSVDHCCLFGRTVLVYVIWWRRCDRQECEKSYRSLTMHGISLSEKRIISQRALAAEKWSSIKATLRSIYCGLILFGQFCLNSVKRWSLPSRLFVGDSIYLQEMLRWNKQVSRILKYRRAIGYFDYVKLLS